VGIKTQQFAWCRCFPPVVFPVLPRSAVVVVPALQAIAACKYACPEQHDSPVANSDKGCRSGAVSPVVEPVEAPVVECRRTDVVAASFRLLSA